MIVSVFSLPSNIFPIWGLCYLNDFCEKFALFLLRVGLILHYVSSYEGSVTDFNKISGPQILLLDTVAVIIYQRLEIKIK